MKKLSWITAVMAALAAAAWAVAVPGSDNSISETPDVWPAARQQAAVESPASAPQGKARKYSLEYASFWRCREHMDRNFARLKTVEQVALECHVSQDVMRRAFMHYGHQTPSQYLIRVKKNHAVEMRGQTA